MSSIRLTFPKQERIDSQKLVDELFTGGHSQSLAAFPVRVVYALREPLPAEPGTAVKILVSVPKKRLRHAVDRNRVKRQLREAWRHSRQPLLDRLPENRSLLLAFVWLSDRLYPTAQVQSCVGRLAGRIASRL